MKPLDHNVMIPIDADTWARMKHYAKDNGLTVEQAGTRALLAWFFVIVANDHKGEKPE